MERIDSHLGHSHGLKHFGAAFAVGVTLNLAYVIAQIVFGIAAHSLALLADAGHNFGDVLGLLLAWGAVYLSKTRPTPRRTYGLGPLIDSRSARQCRSIARGRRRYHLGSHSAIQ